MGVYIKGMDMPTSCGKCRFFAWTRGIGQHCAVAPDITFHATIDGMDVNYERIGDCPLVSVPPHGRLIDADALENKGADVCCSGGYYGSDIWGFSYDMIDDALTIIEAEE